MCLPNCVQVVLCVDMVINTENVQIITEMESICHSRQPTPLEPRKLKSDMGKSKSISRQGLKSPI